MVATSTRTTPISTAWSASWGVSRCGLRRDRPADHRLRIHQRAVELLMAGNQFGTRLWAAVCEPWALLLSTFGGGAVWAFGGSIPLSIATASVMLGTAATVGAFTRSREEV